MEEEEEDRGKRVEGAGSYTRSPTAEENNHQRPSGENLEVLDGTILIYKQNTIIMLFCFAYLLK